MIKKTIAFSFTLIFTTILFFNCNEKTVDNNKVKVNEQNNNVCIYNTRNYSLLLNIENPVEISCLNPCSEIIVHTNNGEVIQRGNNKCHYMLKPNKPGKLTLFVYKKTVSDSMLIASKEFRVKPLFKATAYIAAIGFEGDISINHLLSLKKIKAPLINMDIDIRNDVVSYTFIAFRGKNLLFYEDYKTGNFNDDIKSKFKKLKKKDRIMFTNIITRDIYDHLETINSVEFYIK